MCSAELTETSPLLFLPWAQRLQVMTILVTAQLHEKKRAKTLSFVILALRCDHPASGGNLSWKRRLIRPRSSNAARKLLTAWVANQVAALYAP